MSSTYADDPTIPFRSQSNHKHSTWAGTFHSRPSQYIRPQSLPEVQKLVQLANRQRQRVVVTGAAHSPSDLTCTSSWLVSLDGLDRVLDVQRNEKTGDARVRVQAGLRLHQLSERLMRSHSLIIPNLGSIDSQSIAGAIATATHGSSLYHGILAQNISSIKLCLADGSLVTCSASERPDLFRAALVSLGALGIVVEVEMRMVPTCNVAWQQDLVPVSKIVENWNKGHWEQAEFVRCWWLPYQRNMVVWKADKTDEPKRAPRSLFSAGRAGVFFYKVLLSIANWLPRTLPLVERWMFGLNNGRVRPGHISSGVDEQRSALLMDCLFSQLVNEWAIPLSKGPETITRLAAWLDGDQEKSGIPMDPKGVYVHFPIEVRVTNNSRGKTETRGFLDPTSADEPTLYLNATLYRPFGKEPPCTQRYYRAFEWLMKEMGGRPHWAKNFQSVGIEDVEGMYGEDLREWRRVRNQVDPEGMFLGDWHRRTVLPTDSKPLPNQEIKISETPDSAGGLFVEQRSAGGQVRPSRSEESFDSVGGSTVTSEAVVSLDDGSPK